MGRTTGLLVLHEKCLRAADEPAWDEWADEAHLADVQAGPGAPWVSTRFVLTERPRPATPGLGFTHVTVHELDQADPVAAAATVVDNLRRLRRAGRVHPAHTVVAAETFVAHGRWCDKPEPSAELTGHILTHVLPNDPDREAEWDAWYDEQHVPDMSSCDAFRAMTRWRRVPRLGVGPNHLTLYDVITPTVADAVERSGVTLAELVAAGRKHQTHTGALTLLLAATGRHGGTGRRRDHDTVPA